ncbi:hypothetical protein [Treponema endosymbiont of Eucomonympha sp.]|nr:hypothetical protein [Treponema endosymbiont of Eucomonympha sp.]
MIDSMYIKAHADVCGARDGIQDISRTKGAEQPNYTWQLTSTEYRQKAL